MGEFFLEFIREIVLRAEEDYTAARYCAWSITGRFSDCGLALTGDGQVADEVVTVAHREPLCQVGFWKLSTNDWSGLEGSVFLQMTTKIGWLCHETLLLGVTIRVAVLLSSLGGQVLRWGHVAGIDVGV
jgi:hypothetical protein